MFPGQGSQKVGMGQSLFGHFSKESREASDILGYDIEKICLIDEDNLINQTNYTQPALYFVNALSYLEQLQNGETADIFLGHSLGEYNALFAANVFDLFTGLRLVQKRGELMASSGQDFNGSMAAVIGLDENQINEILLKENIKNIEIANLNSDFQTVLSGEKLAISQAEQIFKNHNAKRYIILPVSGAFHSNYMKKTAEEFGYFLQSFTFQNPEKTIYSNVTAEPHQESTIKEKLVQQIYSSVKWTQTIRNIRRDFTDEFVEIGPGKVLTGLVNKIK